MGTANSIGIGIGLSGSSILPSQISDLVMWVKADNGAYTDAGTTLATNGQTVQQWNNLSTGGNFSQSTSGSRPTFVTNVQNGLPAIRFDGVDDFMANTALSGSAARTIFFTTKGTNASGTTLRFFATNSITSCVFDNVGVYAYYADETQSIVSMGSVAVTSNAVIALNFASATSVVPYINGTAFTSFNPDNSYNSTGFTLAAQNNTGTEHKACDVYEVVVYNRSLTASEMSSVTRYLGNKWGISVA